MSLPGSIRSADLSCRSAAFRCQLGTNRGPTEQARATELDKCPIQLAVRSARSRGRGRLQTFFRQKPGDYVKFFTEEVQARLSILVERALSFNRDSPVIADILQ